MLPIFPTFKFQGIALYCKALKRPERQKICQLDRYLQGRVSKSKLSGEVHSFWTIGRAMLHGMMLNETVKIFSSVFATREDLPAYHH